MDEKDPRLAVRLTPEKIKEVKHFCLDHDLTVQAFLEHAIDYSIKHEIVPK